MKSRIFLILLLLLVHGFAVLAQAEEDKDLALYFPFDEGQGKTAKDLSPFDHKGKIEGAKWVDGKFKKALEFDGASYVGVMPGEEVSIGQETTWQLWYKSDVAGPSGNLASLHGTMVISLSGGNINASVWTNPGGAQWNAINSNVSVQAGQWHQIAVTWSEKSGEATIYVDGEKKNTAPAKGVKSFKGGRQLAIGADDQITYPGQRLVKGMIDEVRIYNRALSAQEVRNALKGPGGLAVFPQGKLSITWGAIKSR